MEQVNLQVLPTRTIYTFEAAGVELRLTFLSPLLTDDLDLLSRPVTEIMTPDVITCAPGDTVGELMLEMTNRRIRHLPVVAEGRLRGIVSIGDVVKNRLEEMQLETGVLRDAYLAVH